VHDRVDVVVLAACSVIDELAVLYELVDSKAVLCGDSSVQADVIFFETVSQGALEHCVVANDHLALEDDVVVAIRTLVLVEQAESVAEFASYTDQFSNTVI
jgi:carbonic anhydrase/acetyltransferase-like protein (isoleucine patch superfamily)